MKLDELIQRVGYDKVQVQFLNETITGAKQRKGFVEVSFGTTLVSMRDLAIGEWENVVMIVGITRTDFDAAVNAYNAENENQGGQS
ncbi:hypothetical protein WCQ02_31330 [Paraburkholderia tropica]|uniref:hypothetical protein n=1 Tax=Paraburkholderia tropica TaxID=92647 RepID=UPI0030198DC6